MNFRKCPRCEEKAYESLRTYGVCHSCNYNTVENTVWKKRRNFLALKPIAHIPEIRDESQLREACQRIFRSLTQGAMFTKTDYAIVRDALIKLPELSRKAIVLKFWNSLEHAEIAQDLGIHAGFIKSVLDQAYEELKKLCLDRPAFSRSPESPSVPAFESLSIAA